MAKKKKGEEAHDDTAVVDRDEAQPALVPMTEQELKDAGRQLAGLVRELEDMEEDHKATREENAAEREALRERISAVASTVRTQGK